MVVAQERRNINSSEYIYSGIKEAKSGAAFNPRNGVYKKDHHYFSLRFHKFMKGILKCVVVMARG